MRILSKSDDFSEIERFAHNEIKILGMIPSVVSYVPPSFEFLGPMTPPVFKPGPSTPPVFIIRLTPPAAQHIH